MINFIINLFFLIVLGIIQISFLTTWPWPASSLNLILSLLIFLTVIINYERALWWALGSGIFLEFYSGLAFGLTTVSLLVTVIIINFLFNNFFTNRSFYTLAILGLIGTTVYNLAILSGNFLLLIFKASNLASNLSFWPLFFWQPIFNLLILTIIFYTYHISTDRLRSIFLFPLNYYETKGRH